MGAESESHSEYESSFLLLCPPQIVFIEVPEADGHFGCGRLIVCGLCPLAGGVNEEVAAAIAERQRPAVPAVVYASTTHAPDRQRDARGGDYVRDRTEGRDRRAAQDADRHRREDGQGRRERDNGERPSSSSGRRRDEYTPRGRDRDRGSERDRGRNTDRDRDRRGGGRRWEDPSPRSGGRSSWDDGRWEWDDTPSRPEGTPVRASATPARSYVPPSPSAGLASPWEGGDTPARDGEPAPLWLLLSAVLMPTPDGWGWPTA